MRSAARLACLAASCAALLLPSPPAAAQPEGQAPERTKAQTEMAQMMENARRFTEPGSDHELLERFLGTWETETRFMMPGMAGRADKGTATFSWLMEGRWLQSRARGTTLGMPSETFLLLGYDNFKQSYVMTTVSSLDTAMLRSEGDLDPSGEALITYGTLDEYLTGEHDKMVKYVWRFLSPAEMVLEVHDLPIGEENTKVLEVRYKKRPAETRIEEEG